MKESELSVDVGALQQDAEYFAKRQLKGAVGWLLLVGLGVSYVISGDFAGWNFGLAQGGWRTLYCNSHRRVYVSLHELCDV